MARILLISDLHGNIKALESVTQSVAYDEVFCLGDLVDYGPDPGECIDWVRSNSALTVRGNHDNAVAYRVDCGCSYAYKHLSEATREYTWALLSDSDIDYLAGLPMLAEKEVDGACIALAHGSPRSFFDYIYPDTPAWRIEELTEGLSCEFLAVGHTHIPAAIKTGRTQIINPGSTGQPRDGDPRASCMVFDTASKEARIVRVGYDIDAVCSKIKEKMAYPDELEAILRRGH